MQSSQNTDSQSLYMLDTNSSARFTEIQKQRHLRYLSLAATFTETQEQQSLRYQSLAASDAVVSQQAHTSF